MIALNELKIGSPFSINGNNFTILDKEINSENGGILAIASESDITVEMPFTADRPIVAYDSAGQVANQTNVFSTSDVIRYLNGEYLKKLASDGIDIHRTIRYFKVDLECSLGQHEYGTCEVKAGLLTSKQFGEYYSILDASIGKAWWLATPWKTPMYGNDHFVNWVWCIDSKGNPTFKNSQLSAYVRPVVVLDPAVLVKDPNWI